MDCFRRLMVGVACASGIAATSCGNSTSGTASSQDGAADGTVEAGDGSNSEDATPDTTMIADGGVDAGPDSMADAPSDGSNPMDAVGDARDGGMDASSPDADAGPDAADGASEAEAGPTTSAAAAFFAQQLALTYCQSWFACCQTRNPGNYDLPACRASFEAVGWEGNLPTTLAAYERPNMVVDQTAATNCINAITAFTSTTGLCPPATGTNPQTAAAWKAVTSVCSRVIQGTIPVGTGGCITSFECAPNSYCDPSVDGGLCTALATQGQACNTKITTPDQNGLGAELAPIPDQMCSYLASNSQGLFCDVINNGPDAGKCQPLLADGVNCMNPTTFYYDDQACASGLCGDDNKCGHLATYPFNLTFCSIYQVIPDAGGGG